MVCYPTYGGSGVIATELGKELASKGHKIHFITYMPPVRLDSFDENLFYHEVGVADYPLFQYPPYETALASKMVDVISHEHLDILHVHYAIPHAAVAFIAKSILAEQNIVCPVVTTLHGTDITLVGKDKSYLPVVKFSIEHSDGVTTVSEFLKKATYEHFDINKEIEVITNFVDFTRFNKTDKGHFKKAIAPNGEKIFIHTSNFRPVKRVEDVILTFNKVKQKIPSKLLLIGDGPDKALIEDLCREKDIMDDVRFLGKQEAVEELLSIGDIFLLPSDTESFGLAALEAMACGLPVISTNTGGLPEFNIQGETGFMSDLGDVDDMAENCLKILADEATLKDFGEKAFKQSLNYDVKNIVPVYEEFYESIIQGVHV